MKKLNNKGYLTIEIILAAVIAFTIAFFLIEITVNFSNASDNYYTDTLFITDKALVSNNVKKNIQSDISNNGIITNVSCTNNKCTITYQNNTTKELKYNNKRVEYGTYSKEVKNLTFKSINVYGSYNEGDYIRFVISFDNTFTNNNYDINILIKNEENITYELLVDHIKELYDDNKDTTVTNNNIEYQYATSVNLMNDRLGGTTESLDGGNIRYYGENVDNYIDIGDRESNGKVILWRIIGIFDDKVRIVRNQPIGGYSWDTSSSNINKGNGINEWSQADLMKLLNPGFETNQDLDNEGNTITLNNSLWWNSESGNCYYGKNNDIKLCNFTSLGLSDGPKSLIVDQTLFLGKFNSSDVYANEIYAIEKNPRIDENPSDGVERTSSWTGKVGLIYPSDIGYASDFNTCFKTLYNYSDECKSNNWLSTSSFIWTITASYSNEYVWEIYSNGRVFGSGACVHNAVFPTMLLKSDVLIRAGTGELDDPYVVKF